MKQKLTSLTCISHIGAVFKKSPPKRIKGWNSMDCLTSRPINLATCHFLSFLTLDTIVQSHRSTTWKFGMKSSNLITFLGNHVRESPENHFQLQHFLLNRSHHDGPLSSWLSSSSSANDLKLLPSSVSEGVFTSLVAWIVIPPKSPTWNTSTSLSQIEIRYLKCANLKACQLKINREIYVTIHQGAKFCLLETLLFTFEG